MDKAKVHEKHVEFVEVIRPLLQADNRNNITKVAAFISRNARGDLPLEEQVRRIKGVCRRSRTIALQIWLSDLSKIYKDQVDNKIMQIIRHYCERNKFNAEERVYFEQLRKEEVNNTYKMTV